MTRDELMEVFDPILASIGDVLGRARTSCGEGDIRRAGQRMGVLAANKLVFPEGTDGLPMVYDLALFEPNERGVRPFDRFLAGPARTLPPERTDIAHRMGGAFFSLFRFSEVHETGGVRVEDVLDDDRPIWLMDTVMEKREGMPDLFAMRLFDAGPFHAGMGVLALASEELVRICLETKRTLGRPPFPQSLAATTYGLMFVDGQQPKHQSGAKFLQGIAKALEDNKLMPTPPARGPMAQA